MEVVERKIDIGILPLGALMERSSWEMGWPEIISSPVGDGLALIAGMSSGVMVTGNLRPMRVFPNSSSYGGVVDLTASSSGRDL